VPADGAEVVEFDIGLMRDEQFVLLHDATLERETDAKKGTWAETQRPFYILAGGRYRFRTCPSPSGTARASPTQIDLRTNA